MPSLLIDNFSGGLNLRDAPNQLAPSETPSCSNFMLTERGGLKRRPGCANIGALPGTAGKRPFLFWSQALGVFVLVRESAAAMHLFTSASGGTGTWTDKGTVNSDVLAQAAFIDFPRAGAGAAGPVVVIATDKNGGATKGTWLLDSTLALSQPASAVNIAGNAIVLWQDRAIVGGYPVSDANGNPTSLFACAPKDPTTWTVAGGGWTQQIREKDGSPVSGLGVVGGAAIVFKKRSTYRLNDSSSGAYTTIDSAVGAVNPYAIAALYGRLYVWTFDGIHECDGAGPLKNVGDKIRPVYAQAGVALDVYAGVYEDTVLFSGNDVVVASAGDVVQFYPRLGAIVTHAFPAAAQNQVASFARASESAPAGKPNGTLFAAMQDGDALFSVFTETTTGMGKDDATGYVASWYTPWLLPNSGMLSRLQRGRVQGASGSGLFVFLDVYRDWLLASPATFDISVLLQPGAALQTAADIMSLGHSPAFAFQFRSDNAAGVNTALSIRALQLIDTPLQWPNPGYPRSTRTAAGSGGQGGGHGGPTN